MGMHSFLSAETARKVWRRLVKTRACVRKTDEGTKCR